MNTRKIFVVDDDELLGAMLSDFLKAKDFGDVKLFNTGEACLQAMKNEKPDVVVLDYHLNAVFKNAANGMKILESIHEQFPDVFVIMLSSQTSYGVATQTIAKGATHYVIKGKDSFEEVASVIEEL